MSQGPWKQYQNGGRKYLTISDQLRDLRAKAICTIDLEDFIARIVADSYRWGMKESSLYWRVGETTVDEYRRLYKRAEPNSYLRKQVEYYMATDKLTESTLEEARDVAIRAAYSFIIQAAEHKDNLVSPPAISAIAGALKVLTESKSDDLAVDSVLKAAPKKGK